MQAYRFFEPVTSRREVFLCTESPVPTEIAAHILKLPIEAFVMEYSRYIPKEISEKLLAFSKENNCCSAYIDTETFTMGNPFANILECPLKVYKTRAEKIEALLK